jgi:predicted phosphodiesterase
MALLGVFGRNDGDRESLSAYAARGMGTEIYESPHSFEVGGKRVLIVHDIAEVSGRSIESHDFVVHGSSHLQGIKKVGTTLVLNPGEACGWIHGKCTAAILDTETGEVENITL